jgi:hypothetical protein
MARKHGMSARTRQGIEPPIEDDDAAYPIRDRLVVSHCREQLLATIKLHNENDDPLRLAVVTVSGMFVDMLVGLRRRTDLLNVVNSAIAGSGLELVLRPK